MDGNVIALPSEPSTLNLAASLHALNEDERRTCESMIRATPAASIIPMPTHHIDQHGRMCGFSFACPGESPISALPLSRNTFFGHTACECDANSSEIVRLLSDVEWAKRKMDGFMKGVRERANVMPLATFSCKPDNAEGYVREGNIAGERPCLRAVLMGVF